MAYTVGLVYDLYSIRGKKLQLCASQIICERNLGTEAAFAFAFVRYSEPPSITKSAVFHSKLLSVAVFATFPNLAHADAPDTSVIQLRFASIDASPP